MNKRRLKLGLIFLISALLLLYGCGAKKTEVSPTATFDTKTPVTVTFATSGGIFSQDEFNQYVAGPVSKKYPNITLQYVNTSQKGSALTDLVAAGTYPDIIVGYGSTPGQLKDLGLYYNIEPLIKKYNFDVNRIIPQLVEGIKINGATDYLGALPAYNNSFGLFYNKSLFDKFGIAYPTDGMTWQQVGDLGKRLTKTAEGVQYRGFFPDGINRMINQIELLQLDKNDKSILTTDPWVKAFQLFNNVYNYPGNSDAPYNKINYGDNLTSFMNGQLAMITGYSSVVNALRKAPDFNWDLVTYPQHPDHMGFSTSVDSPDMCITAPSPNKDA
ncbi:MAG: transporter substrate-binding protein, partial [Bacilli bacterium]|nr:transporter substrate-binding protein [Bacilli bacterium]